MGELRLTPNAVQDLDNIADYSINHWGETQTEVYLTALHDRMIWLAQSPDLGTHREDVAKGYRCFPEGQHLIFYIVDDSGISVIGIPHKAMDIAAKFPQFY